MKLGLGLANFLVYHVTVNPEMNIFAFLSFLYVDVFCLLQKHFDILQILTPLDQKENVKRPVQHTKVVRIVQLKGVCGVVTNSYVYRQTLMWLPLFMVSVWNGQHNKLNVQVSLWGSFDMERHTLRQDPMVMW